MYTLIELIPNWTELRVPKINADLDFKTKYNLHQIDWKKMRIFLLINFVGFYLISAETPEEKEGVKYGKFYF